MYVGIDYHKRYAVATSMDDKGQVIETVRLKNEPGDLIGFVDRLPEDSKIAIEATGNWYYFYELLEGKSPEIHLAHPLKTRGDRRGEDQDRQDRLDHPCSPAPDRSFARILHPAPGDPGYPGGATVPGIVGIAQDSAQEQDTRDSVQERNHHRVYRHTRQTSQGAAQSTGSPELLPAGDRRIYQTDRDTATADRRSNQNYREDRREQPPRPNCSRLSTASAITRRS